MIPNNDNVERLGFLTEARWLIAMQKGGPNALGS